jgi:hypothetical protein
VSAVEGIENGLSKGWDLSAPLKKKKKKEKDDKSR